MVGGTIAVVSLVWLAIFRSTAVHGVLMAILSALLLLAAVGAFFDIVVRSIR